MRFQITHPFHPDGGSVYTYVEIRKSWGEERIYYYREDTPRLQWVALSWTDLRASDEFFDRSSGRAHFRVSDLLALCRAVVGDEEC